MEPSLAPCPVGLVPRASGSASAQRVPWPRVSVIIPTLNERQNIPLAIAEVGRALRLVAHDIIVVDDGSTDGTVDAVRQIESCQSNLRLLTRKAPNGLTGAILDGFLLADSDLVAVIDADLQHDVSLLAAMVKECGTQDLVVGSRYCEGGGHIGWNATRSLSSRITAFISRRATGLVLSDPLSGFFCIRRSCFLDVKDLVPTRGWKILLEILGQSRPLRVKEIPYSFLPRQHGKSKLDTSVVWEWARQVARLFGRRLMRVLRVPGFATIAKEAAPQPTRS